MTDSRSNAIERCDDAEVMRLWRECGLPEYFLFNAVTNYKLVEFARRLRQPAQSSRSESNEYRVFYLDRNGRNWLWYVCAHRAEAIAQQVWCARYADAAATKVWVVDGDGAMVGNVLMPEDNA